MTISDSMQAIIDRLKKAEKWSKGTAARVKDLKDLLDDLIGEDEDEEEEEDLEEEDEKKEDK